MDNRFEVTVSAGTMMSSSGATIRFPHRWTPAVANASSSSGEAEHDFLADDLAR